MKISTYFGQNGDSLEIEQPTDIHSILDWAHSQMLDKQDEAATELDEQKWQKAIDFLGELMQKTEDAGFFRNDI